jgi:aminoglycoside/choline kinase family phosphotransferase
LPRVRGASLLSEHEAGEPSLEHCNVITTVPVIDFAPLEALVASTGETVVEVRPMVGGASTRSYFRVRLSPGSPLMGTYGTTAVGVFVPGGDRPEEIASHDSMGPPRRWPFLEVLELLTERGVRVPRLFAEDTRAGWLLIEDLGDETLAARLASHPDERASLYIRAVADLQRAQRALASLPPESVVLTRAFDEDLLRKELDHFREWGLDARDRSLRAEDRTALDGIFDRLARRIASLPPSFVHRDYQSTNLMCVRGELAWIDFQDALLGPRVYDLVALLHDSYQDLDDAFVNARLAEYEDAADLSLEARAELQNQFDLVAVQRKLKDAGRFVFIDRAKRNSRFLPYVTPTLRKVARTLDRLAGRERDMSALRAILRHALPEEFAL